MSPSLSKLQDLLSKLFRVDAAGPDCGIYRIINFRRDRLQSFIDKTLVNLVNEALNVNSEMESAHQELESLANQIRENIGEGVLDVDGNLTTDHYDDTELVKKYRNVKEQAGTVQGREERQEAVYNHLYTFFSRYYDNGDFIPLRRYSRSERYMPCHTTVKKCICTGRTGISIMSKAVNISQCMSLKRFLTLKWSSTSKNVNVEKDNVKSENRFFIPLSAETDYNPENNEVRIPFEYRPLH